MPTVTENVRKSAQDTAYLAIGVGVLGAQQVQARAQAAGSKLESTASTGAHDARERFEAFASDVKSRVEPLVTKVEQRIEPLLGELEARIEPVVEKAKAKATAIVETGTERAKALFGKDEAAPAPKHAPATKPVAKTNK
jgi:hypothetical protein